jgi:hypothetical protein
MVPDFNDDIFHFTVGEDAALAGCERSDEASTREQVTGKMSLKIRRFMSEIYVVLR